MSGYNRDTQRQYDNQSPPEDSDMYDETDAEGDVANTLIEDGDVHELVTDVRAAVGALRSISEQSPWVGRDIRMRGLLRWAEKLDGMVDAQVELMTNKEED